MQNSKAPFSAPTSLILLGSLVVAILFDAAFMAANAAIQTQADVTQASTSSEDLEHGGHAEHENVLKLTAQEMSEFAIEIAKAGPGVMDIQVSLPGEVKLNADRLAHVTPRLSGVVQEVFKNVGDTVRKGDVMAVLESRELATAKAAYFAAGERVKLAESAFARESKLWKDKISAEKDYLEARQALAEAQIEARSARQQLEAIGLPAEKIRGTSNEPGAPLTRFEMTAPFDGTVIEKHIALGEALDADAQAFTVADLSTVWVDVSVYQKHLLAVRQGQEVVVSAGAGIPDATGTIAYIGPIVGEETRAAVARVLLPNIEHLWRPGLFVNVSVAVEQLNVPVVVQSSALQILGDETVVFVEDAGAFKPAHVQVGRVDADRAEIVKGLEAGTSYVAQGSFHLKAELEEASFGEQGHSH